MPNKPESNRSRRDFLHGIAAVGAASAAGKLRGDEVPLAPPDEQPPNLIVPDSSGRKIGWAIVGLGVLALEEIMPAFADCKHSRPVALVSGHPSKAKRVAQAYGMDPAKIYNYENYDKIANDPDVDAIYIVLPNSMHAEFTNRGLRAGKHVLCEKPMASTVEESEEMIRVAEETGKKLMIAYRLHFEPMNQQVMKMCQEEKFGKLKTISSSNCQNVEAPNIRLSKELAGGPVSDTGIYCINAARYCTGEEPESVTAVAHSPADDPRFREVPASVAFTLKFPSGVLAHCDCSFDSAVSRPYRVHCANGLIDMRPGFSYRGLKLMTDDGEQEHEWQIPEINQFAAEMDHFSQCILNDEAPRTPGAEGLADMRVLAAIDLAIESGRSQPVKA